MAFSRQQHCKGRAEHIALLIAQQRFGRAVDGENMAFVIQHHNAICGCIENIMQFAGLALPRAQIQLQRLQAGGEVGFGRAQQEHKCGRRPVPCERLRHTVKRQCLPLGAIQRHRRVPCLLRIQRRSAQQAAFLK